MNQPDLIIVHGPSCADGFAAAWTLTQRWPGVPVHTGVYGEPPPAVDKLGVLIADFSYPEAELRAMAAAAKWVHVLDHHATAKADLEKLRKENLIRVDFADDRSGAALAFEYAWGAGRVPPMLIQYVEDRDLWRFTLEGTREVHALLMSHPMDMDVWGQLAKRLEDPGKRPEAIREGAAILRDRERSMRQILEASIRFALFDGHEVPVANVPYAMASDAGNLMCETLTDSPFSVTYFDRGDGMRQFSLRSLETGPDVGAIAKKFGGGGHAHAAGFTLPISTLKAAKLRFDFLPLEAPEDPAGAAP